MELSPKDGLLQYSVLCSDLIRDEEVDEFLDIIDAAKRDLQQMLMKEKERQELSFMNTGGGLWSNNDNVVVNIYIKWYNKWFGGKDD